MLSTVMHHYGLPHPYKPTHKNHPCTIWARESSLNFMWLIRLARALNEEYKFRFNKNVNHKSWDAFRNTNIPMKAIPYPSKDLTKFAQAMPEKYRSENAVEAYRSYYLEEKSSLLKYTKREKPYWISV